MTTLAAREHPDLVVEPAVEPAPLAVLLDVLRGRGGAVPIRDERGETRYVFDWVADTLRDVDGRLLFRRTDEAIHDGAGRLAFSWDSLYLCGPRREYLFETRRCGETLAFDRFRGLNVMQTDGTTVGRTDRKPRLRADHPIPPVFASLAWSAFTKGGER